VQILNVSRPTNPVFKTDFYTGSFTALPSITYDFPVKFLSNSAGEFKDKIMFITATDTLSPEIIAIAEETTDIERVYDPSFSISPNPATGFSTINLPSFKSRNPLLKIYDALGNEVGDFSGKVNGSSFTLDTRTLPNGAYFVRFTDGSYSLLRTFVVNN